MARRILAKLGWLSLLLGPVFLFQQACSINNPLLLQNIGNQAALTVLADSAYFVLDNLIVNTR